MNKLKQTLEKALKSEPAFCDSESEELNYTKVKDSADKIDKKLISLLADNKDLKNKFFTKIKDVYVFNIQDFKFFLDESKVDNSYTQYANKIGLADNSGLLENRSEVVLDFPFKDCVLEGGQSTEEGTDTYFEYSEKTGKYEEKNGKRNEIFFNQVLAHDEIDRLYDRKALINWKRFNKDSKKDGEAVKEIKRDKSGLIQENLIIKGNNLLALHSLKSEFAGKIKLIYIDPPYNTGTDSFAYNDRFNHSTWLTFMKNRLEVAQDLLRDDGIIFVQIDNSPSGMDQSPELGYLYVLMDQIFKRKNYITTLVWKKKGNASNTEENIGTITESILVYSKDTEKTSLNLQDYKRDYKYEDENGNYYNLEHPVKTNDGSYERTTMLFGIKTKEGVFYPEEGKRWTIGEETAKDFVSKGQYEIRNGKFYLKKYPQDYKKGEYKLHNNLLDTHGSLKSAKNELKKLGFNREDFDSPKPEILIQRIIEIGTSENEIVLDYHLGSGTTCAVAHKMNRQYIGIEQMDYVETIAVERIKKVVQGEQGGISNEMSWKGGGEFIYFELAKWNEQAKEEIQNAKDLPALVKLFDTLYERYFLNYNVKIKDFKDKIIKEENFKKLTLAQQKKMFLTMLDLNQMYVQESEMADKKYGISTEDQKLTKAFYSKK